MYVCRILWLHTNVRISIVRQLILLVLLFISPLLLLVCLSVLWLFIIALVVLSSVRPFVWYSVRPSVCMYLCTYVETNVLVYVLWTLKIELTWLIDSTLSGLSLQWTLTSFLFSCRGSNDGIADMSTILCKNYVYDRLKSTHIFVSDNIVLFHKSFMTVMKGKSQTRYNFL